MENLLSVPEFARLHAVSHQAIYYKLKTNKIKYILIGKSKFIEKTAKYKCRMKNKRANNQSVNN